MHMKPGERVELLRKLRGLSQTSLGRAVGLSQSSISLLESGDRRLLVEEAERLARVLQCSLYDLVGSSTSITITFHPGPSASAPGRDGEPGDGEAAAEKTDRD